MQIQYMNMYMKNRSKKKVVVVDVVVDVVVVDDLMVVMMMMRWSCMGVGLMLTVRACGF